jgi:amino acid adenylation domain-containing protein
MYGPTEATIISAVLEIRRQDGKRYENLASIPIGQPVANLNLLVLDRDFNVCPLNIVGQLYIGGDGLAPGYLNNPDLTADKFVNFNLAAKGRKGTRSPKDEILTPKSQPLYRTGDLVRFLPDGNVEFMGRIDTQVKIRGFRIELGEIESRLLTHRTVRDALVATKEDAAGAKYLCAYVVFDTDRATNMALRKYLTETLPDYMVPAYFIPLDQIPLNPNGKVNLKALPEPKIAAADRYAVPRNHIEEKLAAMWSEVLFPQTEPAAHPAIGIDDNFFELGGHSLKATTLAARMQKTFDIQVPLTEIFRIPTIRELGQYVGEAVKEKFVAFAPVEKKDYYALSSAQRRLYILHQMDVDSTAYNIPQSIPLDVQAEVDAGALARTFRRLIVRHESLRTSFHMVKDEPVQRVHEEVKFQIEYYNMAAKDAKGREIKNFVRHFDLSGAPLLRVGLTHPAPPGAGHPSQEGRYVLMVDMHHIIADGVSMQVLVEDFKALYRGETPAPLPIQYKDFAHWQNLRKTREILLVQQAYWLKILAGDIPVLNLPLDYPRPAVQDFSGATLGFRLGSGESAALKQLARQRGVTLYMVLLAAVTLLMSRLSGQEDIIIGTPTAGRRHADLEKIIGMFVNTLAIRSQPPGQQSFEEFLEEVKANTLAAFENQDYQFEDLVEKVKVERDTGRNPLFDVMFTLQTGDDREISGPAGPQLDENLYNPDLGVSKFDLTWHAADAGAVLLFSVQYAARLFKPGTIQRFIDCFKRILAAVLADPGRELCRLAIVGEEEKQRILLAFNDTGAGYSLEASLHGLFEERVKEASAQIAAVSEESCLTYGELDHRAGYWAEDLRERGVRPDTVVAIMMERSLEMIIGIMAILKAGGAYLPVDPGCPPERLDYILTDSGADIVLTGYPGMPPCGGTGRLSLPPSTVHPTPVTSLAYVIYTSGSTGRPKGVMIRHRSINNLVKGLHERIYRQYQQGLRIALAAPFQFDASVKQVFAALLLGHSLVIVPAETRLDGEKLLEFFNTYQIDVCDATPTWLHLLLDHLPPDRAGSTLNVKHFLIGGEALPPELVETFLCRLQHPGQAPPTITNVYGPTECSVDSTAVKITGENIRLHDPLPIGKPLPNVQIYILDRHKNLQPVGIPGEIYIGGAGLARGYVNQPELTADKFVDFNLAAKIREDTRSSPHQIPTDSPLERGAPKGRGVLYKTGDLGRWLPDGSIEFLGRLDFQVKIRGYRIELGEIENQLLRHPDVKEAVVIDRQDAHGDQYLAAYLVCQKAEGTDVQSLRDFLSPRLPVYMIPASFIILTEIPVNAAGKVDRKALAAAEAVYPPGHDRGQAARPPQDEIESQLLAIWSEVLDLEKPAISVDSNFFHLGGHSLKALLLVSSIFKVFQVKIPLVEIFRAPFIKGLASLIKESAKDQYTAIQAVEEREYYALSSAQKRLYFLKEMDPHSTAYNMFYYLHLRPQDRLEESGFDRVFKKLIERHDSLRTSFDRVDGEPVQRIHRQAALSLEVFEAPETEAAGVVRRFQGAFDLGQAPLLRAGLIQLTHRHYILMVELHHIIADGTSTTILFEDFKALYSGERLPPLELRYRDFSQWQNLLFASGQIAAQENYWLDLYRGEIPRLHLPADFERPEVFTFSGSSYLLQLDPADMASFKSLAASYGGTLYMNMLAALNVLFYKTCGQVDIIVGSGIAGRPHADLQGIIGMFVNTLAMRNYPNGDKTYEVFLKEVIAGSIQAFENQDVPFEELVDKLDLERDPSRNPLFDAFMLVQNFRRVKSPGSLDVPPPYLPSTENQNLTAKFDLSFYILEAEDEVIVNIEYYTPIFRPETIRRLSSYLLTIIKTVGQDPRLPLKHIAVISEAEKHQILHEFNHTAHDYPQAKNICDLFVEQAERSPHRAAALQGERLVTYRQLDERSNRLANFLKSGGSVETGERLGILMDRSLTLLESILGVLKAGAAYVPISGHYPGSRVRTIVDDADIGFMISEKKSLGLLDRLQWECRAFRGFLCMDSLDIYAEEAEPGAGALDDKLWDYVGESGADEITSGGWQSSYTGEPLSRQEMAEYGENIYQKLSPLLHREMRVLEIGCSTGITMYRLAPQVGFYHGTDLSGVIIRLNRERVEREGCRNIALSRLAAHEIHRLAEADFDLVVLNSVVQYFRGYNYLRKVIRRAIGCLKQRGHLFLGDIMDLDLKEALIRDLARFKQANSDKPYKTRIDWSSELFVPRGFWQDLAVELPQIGHIEFSPKIHTIENELTRYRYDVLMTIDRSAGGRAVGRKCKSQYDVTALAQADSRALRCPLTPAQAAYVMYTSGSTGTPRGVVVEHGPVVNLLSALNRAYASGSADVLLFKTPHVFDVSVTELFGWFLAGSRVAVLEEGGEKDAAMILTAVERCGVTHINFVPAMYRVFLDYLVEMAVALDRLSSLKYIFLAGEAVSPSLAVRSRLLGPAIALENIYGPTEAVVYASRYALAQWQEGERLPIGKPLANVQIYILDRAGYLQPVGVAGELCIAGVGLARGYLNQPELTADKFVNFNLAAKTRQDTRSSPHQIPTDSPLERGAPKGRGVLYKTGDLARFRPDGNIEFLGRIDQQVKIRGYRIELGEIENQLLKHPDVRVAVVIDRAEDNQDRYLAAYFVGNASAGALQEFLARSLPDYMIPPHLVRLDRLPLTASEKIDRRALPEPAAEKSLSHTPPRSPIEEKLARIWQEVLGLDTPPGIDANFFETGGHSLKATVMITKIHKTLEVNLPLAEIFKTPTIRGLAGYIGSAAAAAPADPFAAIRPAEDREYYVLSSAQKRLFVLQQMDVKAVAYNMPETLALEGRLDMGQLERAFAGVIRRHQSLRTSFHLVDGEPVQKIHRSLDFAIQVYKGDPEEGRADVTRNFSRAFDLSQAPLLRVGLLYPAAGSSGDHCRLMVDMHHIVCDGISINILTRELTALYENRALPGLRLQYRDYCLWQQQPAVKAAIGRQQAYWLGEFAAEIPVLNLPTDFPRPHRQSFSGESLAADIDSRLLAGLRKTASSLNVTLYMLLLGACYILLQKLSGQQDIVVGTPLAARRHADLEPIIGMFVNTLALRSRPVRRTAVADYLRQVKAGTLRAFENQEYPFEELVERVMPRRDASRNPLFDVMFTFQPLDPQPAYNGRPADAGSPGQTAKFDITLMITETEHTLRVACEYCTSLFKAETVRRFLHYFKRIVSRLAQAAALTIAEIDILSAEERHRLLDTFNDTAAAGPTDTTIGQRFEEQVRRTPFHVALVGPGQSAGGGCPESAPQQISYLELNRESDRLAQLLQDEGIAPDTIGGIVSERSVEMVVGLLAILKAGGAYLPIDPQYPEERSRYMLADSAAEVVLTDHRDRLPSSVHVHSLLVVDGRQASRCMSRAGNPGPVPGAGPANLAYVIYTSGSSGRPKGVAVRQRGLVNMVAYHRRVFKENPRARLSQVASPAFDAMAIEVWPCLLAGACLCIVDNETRLNPRQLKEWLIRCQVTISFQPTPLAQELLAQQWPETGVALEILRTGGDRLTRYPGPSFPFRLYNLYGPTEDTVWTTWAEVPVLNAAAQGMTPPSIGKPVANHRVYILDEDLELQPLGVVGELCISGEGLAPGYLNNPELTADKFVDFNVAAKAREDTRSSPHQIPTDFPLERGATKGRGVLYKTGDLARWRDDGHLEFIGRQDHQVKIRGFRVELPEIENRLLEHPGVREAVVIDRQDGRKDRYLTAYFVGNTSAGALREFLARSLPDYMIPAHLVRLEGLPLTANGKVDRKALPQPEPGTVTAYTAPRDPVEHKLAGIWQEVLGLEAPVGIDADFFALGGHSLKATLTVARIQQTLGVELPLADLFGTPTIRGLAGRIQKAAAVQAPYTAIAPVEAREYYVVSSAQRRLYLLQQIEMDGRAYNMPEILVLPGKPDIGQLEKAFRRLIRRHESLRTSFHLLDGEPFQKIHHQVDFEIQVYEREPGGGDQKAAIIKSFIRPFDLARPPLLRVGLFYTPAGDGGDYYLLMVDMHHIVCDGLSMNILTREFRAFYEDRPLPEPRLQYRDYAHWQVRPEVRAAILRQKAYWIEQFADQVPVLSLFTDFPRPPVQSFDGGVVEFELGQLETTALNQAARLHGTTLFMVMLAVYSVFLAKLSTQEDIVVGIPVAGRKHADLEELIGVFINTLPLRSYPSGEKSFSGFLEELKRHTLAAFDNQDYPFEELVDNLDIQRDVSRNPLFDTMFLFQNFLADGQQVSLTDNAADGSVSKLDLSLYALENGERLYFRFEYCSRLFKRETVVTFVEYYKKVILSVLRHPAGKIADIEIITGDERERVLHRFNDTRQAFPLETGAHRLFEGQAKRAPHHVAVTGPGQAALTYRELDERADRLAYLLRERGAGTDTIVGIMVPRCLEMITAIWGVWKSGGAYLPIDPDYPRERIDYMLADSGAEIVLGESIDVHAPSVMGACGDEGPASPPSLAYVIYTSGSTGKPKGVMIRHRSLVNFIMAMTRIIDVNRADTVLSLTTICFDIFGLETILPLTRGARVMIGGSREQTGAAAAARVMQERSVSILQLTPSRLAVFLASRAFSEALAGLKYLLVGGEALPLQVLATARPAVGGKIYNLYGPTETTIWSTVKEVSAGSALDIGKPIANTGVYILDRGGALQPIGLAGELYISGEGLARGYLNNPELTADKFMNLAAKVRQDTRISTSSHFTVPTDSPLERGAPKGRGVLYRTGDLARFLPDGNIEFIGRQDHQVKIRGYRLELGEIEHQLLNHSDLKEAVVVDRQDDHKDRYLAAYFVPHPTEVTDSALSATLREYLSSRLPDYMIPAHFVQLDQIPLTPAGKVFRQALPRPEVYSAEEYEAPRSPQEEQLVALYRELLGVEDIGIQADFFALGGNSLKAIKLASRIHEMFNLDIPIMQVFKTPRIKDLAPVIEKGRFIENREETVVLLNSPGPRKIFAFPPAVGFGIAYTELAPLLPDYAFYAFNFIESRGEDKQDRMDVYLAAMREIQPEDPYILLGYSAGARLCVKAAGILEAAGQRVSDIIILDSYTRMPGLPGQEMEDQAVEFYRGIEQGLQYLGIQHLKQKVMDTLNSYRQYHQSLELAGRLEAAIHLIQAADRFGQQEFVGWQAFSRDREIVYRGHGLHREMLSPDFIEKNAAVIEQILAHRKE